MGGGEGGAYFKFWPKGGALIRGGTLYVIQGFTVHVIDYSFRKLSMLRAKNSMHIFCCIIISPTILDKINGTSGPPLPPFQWCQNGTFLLLRAFIIALGGGWGIIVPFYSVQDCLSTTLALQEAVLYLLCRSHLICCRTFDNHGKRTLAEIKSDHFCERFKQNWNKITTWFIFGVSCTLLIWKLNMHKCVLKCWPKAKLFL